MQASKLEHTVVVVAAILILSMLSLYTSIIEPLYNLSICVWQR